jgi:hypothetical protein
MKTKIAIPIFLFCCGLLWFGIGCFTQTGTLTINLTDQPASYDQVYITFSEISVHLGEDQDVTTAQEDDADADQDDNNWIIVSTEEQGFDLLALQDGKFDLLASANLPAGIYSQIRLKIVEGDAQNPKTYVQIGEQKFPLTIPSGTSSGLKLTHPFKVEAGAQTVLYLDFDAARSVHQTGNDQYKLKPTIAILSELDNTQGIEGIVQDAGTNAPIVNATISAVKTDDVQQLQVGSTMTDDEGEFKLPLPAGSYTLTITAAGYQELKTEPIIVESQVWNELENPIKLTPQAP